MEGFITRYFQAYLRTLGWDVDFGDIRWSLSSCQGDGVSFTYKMDADDLKPILNSSYQSLKKPDSKINAVDRINYLIESRQLLSLVKEHDAIFSISQSRSNYFHSGTMSMDLEICEPPEDGDQYNELEEKLVDWGDDILETARGICNELESKGYDILYSSPDYRLGNLEKERVVRTIKTKFYKVDVIEGEDDMYCESEEEDDKHVIRNAESIIEGKMRVVTLSVKVSCLTTDCGWDEVGRAVVGGVSHEPGDKTYSGLLRETVAEAVNEARAALCIQKKQSPPDLPELQMAS